MKMNKLKSLILTLLLAVAVGALPALGQTTLNSTTLNEAVSNSETRIDIASASSVSADDIAFVDLEAMLVISVDSTNNRIRVQRGYAGTVAVRHANGQTIWIDAPSSFISKDLSGACTKGSEFPNFQPLINVSNGNAYYCQSSVWDREEQFTRIIASYGNVVRINNHNFNNTTGDATGFQSKPGQAATTTGNLKGGEISPRFQDGFTANSIIGLHVDVDLKGTTAVTTDGDVRGMEVELVTSNSGTRTISGYVTAMRFRTVFSATTITGNFTVFRFEKPEAQTNSQSYDAWADFRSTVSNVWNHDPGTEVSGSIKGYIKVIVNGVNRWIALYDTGPTD
jgi:hypothetical protein